MRTSTLPPRLSDLQIGFAVEQVPSPLFPEHPSRRHVVTASYKDMMYVMYRLGEFTREQLLAELEQKLLERGVIRESR